MSITKVFNDIDYFDSDNHLIQAHGSKIYYFNNTYYWIGENKELTDGKNGIWHNGVNCYSTKDFTHWKYEGNIVPANDLPDSTLNRKSQMDRPHILYNQKKGYYVMWLKIMHEDGTQDMTILKANDILGPYELIKEHYHPFNFSTGDFDLVIVDDKAYWFYEIVHSGMGVSLLDDEYLNAIDYTILEDHKKPPFTREGLVYFNYQQRHFLVSSGTTGYFANPSMIYELKTIKGPIINRYYSHINDVNHNSFNTQMSGVVKINNQLVFIADIWYPNNQIKYPIIEEIFDLFANNNYILAEEKMKGIKELIPIDSTKDAKYHFFDLTIKDNNPYFEYKNILNITDK